MDCFVAEQATLEAHSLWGSQPVKHIPEDRSDVVVTSPTSNNPGSVVEDRLYPVEVGDRLACKKTVAVVDPGKNEALCKLDGRLHRKKSLYCLYSA